MVTTRNAFVDPIEDPDTNTKILAKDGTDAAGYVTVGDLSDLISGSDISDLGPLPTTATNPMSLPEADITQSLTTWINSLTPKLFYKDTVLADYNDAQFVWGAHFVSYLDFISNQTEAHAPQIQATASIVRHALGSGTFGANSGDYSLFVVGRKTDYLTSTVEGEIGGLWANTWQGKFGDCTAILGDASKYITVDGTGGLAGAEIGGRRVDVSGTAINLVKGIIGFITPEAFSPFGGNGACCYWAEPQIGDATVLYYGTSDPASDFDYALKFSKQRSDALTFFSVDDTGTIMQGPSTGRRYLGMNGTTWEMKNTLGTLIGSWEDSGNLTITGIAYFSNASAFIGGWTLSHASGYSTLADVNSHGVLTCADAADPSTYYNNTNHKFRSRDGATTFAQITTLAIFNVPTYCTDIIASGKVSAAGGVNTKQAVNNVHDTTPTAAELTTAFGSPATVGRGFIGTVDDADGDTNGYICWTSDASWYFLKGTKAA